MPAGSFATIGYGERLDRGPLVSVGCRAAHPLVNRTNAIGINANKYLEINFEVIMFARLFSTGRIIKTIGGAVA
jgi:hypothetical protein